MVVRLEVCSFRPGSVVGDRLMGHVVFCVRMWVWSCVSGEQSVFGLGFFWSVGFLLGGVDWVYPV